MNRLMVKVDMMAFAGGGDPSVPERLERALTRLQSAKDGNELIHMTVRTMRNETIFAGPLEVEHVGGGHSQGDGEGGNDHSAVFFLAKLGNDHEEKTDEQ